VPGHEQWLVYHKADYRWRAVYETAKGTPYTIDDTEIAECPVSYMSPENAEIVASLELARQVREATDESPLPPVKQWPVTLIDAARIIAVENIKDHNARIEAEEDER
jgi:hypothetical protein